MVAKSDLDLHFQQLSLTDDMTTESLTDELTTREGYTDNFEKMEESFYRYMNRILKQNKIMENIHKSYQNAAAVSPLPAMSSSGTSSNATKLNIRYKPIEIPVFDPAKTQV